MANYRDEGGLRERILKAPSEKAVKSLLEIGKGYHMASPKTLRRHQLAAQRRLEELK
jgi:hypothetical protein